MARPVGWISLAAVATLAVAGAALYYYGGHSGPGAEPSTTSSSSSGLKANLEIRSTHVSHSLDETPVAASCSSTAPPQGASFVSVTNTGEATSTITGVAFTYVDMSEVTDSGSPTGDCIAGPGATVFIIVTGIGMNVATSGEDFGVTVTGSNGGLGYSTGQFA